VHGYQYQNAPRAQVYNAVVVQGGKELRVSEYGEGDGSGAQLATNLNLDFALLHPHAWTYWQIFDVAGGWGLMLSDVAHGLVTSVNNKYFVVAQYSRHVRVGMSVISGGDPTNSTVAAYDATGRSLTLVQHNPNNAQTVTFDLSKFSTASGPIACWTTSLSGKTQYQPSACASAINGGVFTVPVATGTITTIEVSNVVV